MVKIGKMRHRLGLRSPVKTQGSTGESVTTWPSVTSTVWGSLRPLSGKEREEATQTNEEVNYRARIRYNSSINSEWRISNDSNTYEIVTILNFDELDEQMIIDLKRIR
jgi:SPP1 family predicted phage head-tail adaptor